MFRLRPPPQFHPAVGLLNATAAGLFVALAVAGLPLESEPAAGGEVEPAAGVLLFVVDGLRADEAADPTRMPFLASRPNRSIARVETPVPCSAAAIETWVHGRVPSAWAMLTDFEDGRRADGGLIEAVRRSGRPVAVCGPTLWTGRYAAWSHAVVADATFGLRDEEVIDAALTEARSVRGLLVVHVLGLDAAGHRRADRDEVTALLRRIDAAARRLTESMPPGAAMLVVSDHGRSADGGHAGGEAAVRETPVVLIGGGPLTSHSTQRDTHRLLAGLLDAPATSDGRGLSRWLFVAAAIGIASCGCLGVRPTYDARDGAFVGLAALTALVMTAAAWASGAAWVAASAACLAALVHRADGDWRSAVTVLLGVAVAVVADAVPTLYSPAIGVALALGAAFGMASAAVVRNAEAKTAGVLLAVTLTTLPFAMGQSTSLSSLDTRGAFGLVNGTGGVPLAAALILAANALPLMPLAWAIAGRPDASNVLAAARPVLLGGAGACVAVGRMDWLVRATAEWVVMGVAVWLMLAASAVYVSVPERRRVEAARTA